MEDEILTTTDVAKILKVSYSKANDLMHSDKLETFNTTTVENAKKAYLRTTITDLKNYMRRKND